MIFEGQLGRHDRALRSLQLFKGGLTYPGQYGLCFKDRSPSIWPSH